MLGWRLGGATSGLTIESFPGYTIGSSAGSATTLKAFTLSPGTSGHLFAFVSFTGGTAAAPTSYAYSVVAAASRTNAGVYSVQTPAVASSEIVNLHVHWDVVGTTVALRFHYHSGTGPTVNATLTYTWIELTPP